MKIKKVKQMNFKNYFKMILSIPPQKLYRKVLMKIRMTIKNKLQKSKDLSISTYISFNISIISKSYIDVNDLDITKIDENIATYLSKKYCEHRFDLLGSGWIKNSYTLATLSNVNNLSFKSQNNDINYESIDWQKDCKSGYRWSENNWYKEQPSGHKEGVDIKLPWELSRLQHLPQLAIFTMVDKSLYKQNITEFKYQVLDFIQNNPPRIGVNWSCTMDVAIRAANLLVAYDMFIQYDMDNILDNKFKQIFSNSIYEHGIHIFNNLEVSYDGYRNNHYLSNIVGLLYISAYLNETEETKRWLDFSFKEIIKEIDYQFYEDGGNFESSTSYHRLSGEMILYSTALILSIPSLKNKLPSLFVNKLYLIGQFSFDLLKENGNIPQFGDNDSGRLFKFTPIGSFLTFNEVKNKYLNLSNYDYKGLYWDENHLNHQTFLSAMGGLFNNEIFNTVIPFEKSFIETLSSHSKLVFKGKKYLGIPMLNKSNNKLKFKKVRKYLINTNLDNLESISYPNSGIYIYKTKGFYLAINVMPLGQKGKGGHKHNDTLSYELMIDNKELFLDPGTYLYTSNSKYRNKFRSINSHNVPIINGLEENDFKGLFGLKQESIVSLNEFSNNYIKLTLKYKNIIIQREFNIKNNELIIEDSSNKEFNYNNFEFYSNGYGKIERIKN